jgi:N-acetylmuramoyl-L-alanine amidase
LAAGLAALLFPACGHGHDGRAPSKDTPDAQAASGDAPELLHARLLAEGESPLPERAEALSLAESIEARAVHEGAGPRSLDLHSLAARLLERVWRVEGREQDAREALDIYAASLNGASRIGPSEAACASALAAARLQGDVSHDAVSTYAEAYRAQRRFAASPACARAAEDVLSLLAAFRPPQRVLEAIDEGLAGEGSIGPDISRNDAGLIPVRAPQVTQIDVWPGQDAARIVIVLDRPANYRVGDEATASNGAPRTTIDFDGVELGAAGRDFRTDGVVTRVRAEATTTGSRVEFDLEGRPWRRVFPMQEPYRLVVDIARNPPGARAGSSARSVTRLVLDPGHGGRDTGAVGPSGVKEKDVTLDIAHRVAPVLAAQGVQVVLTRDDDRFVSLEERTARANAFAADLFVSIHCNASESRLRRGVETYVLDTTRDEVAARVAARENATTQAASAELSSILGGMRMAADARRSTQFAQLLQRAATTSVRTKYGDVVDGGVHTAGFYVLVGARMPSVLFETSYVSSSLEETRLGTADYRQLLADAVINAVRAYRQGR